MSEHLLYFFNTFVAVFVIVDPFAVVPVYLSLTERFTQEERRRIRHKASMVALCVLTVFAITGMGIFNIFHITLPAFRIAGGILLLIFGINQLNSKRVRVTEEEQQEGMESEDISVFPLATPLLAGPGSISTVVLFSTKAQGQIQFGLLLLSIICVILVCHLFLRIAPLIFRLLGTAGLNLLTRLMGIILTAVAVQTIINGIRAAFLTG